MSMIVFAAILLSGQAASPPARPATDLTRDLNSAPPSAAPIPRPPVDEPAPARPAPTTPAPSAQATSLARTTPTPQGRTGSSLTRDLNSGPAATAPVTRTPPAATSTPAPRPSTTSPAPTAAQPAAAASSPSAPEAPVDPLAALPFRIDLPEGFTIEPSDAGPQAKVYAVKRDGRSFVMIYQGPASQFPIYDGQLIDAGGRASVVIEEGGRRRAVEHLFAKDLESRETHVWLSYLEGPDSAQAEQIAQSVEPR